MEIKKDDLNGPEIAILLQAHIDELSGISIPESMHALSMDALRNPEITFWSVWANSELMGCGALKELDSGHGEVKSMRTAPAHLRKGVASRLLKHIIDEAKRRGCRRLSLETGSSAHFEPALKLYQKVGFRQTNPFGDYTDDPNSVFLTLELPN